MVRKLVNKRWKHFRLKNIFKIDPTLIDINPGRQSLKKVLYWRAIAFIISSALAYVYIKDIYSSIEMTIVEVLMLTSLHFIFEELWGSKKQ